MSHSTPARSPGGPGAGRSYPGVVALAFQIVLSALLIIGGVTVLVTGWRGLRGTLPRNRFAGVRTPPAMRSDESFTVANRVAAPATLAGGAVLVLVGACLLPLRTPSSMVLLLVIGLLGATALILVGGVLGNRAATALVEQQASEPAGACAGCPGGGCAALLTDAEPGTCRG